MSDDKSAVAVLRGAAEWIRVHGWTQGAYGAAGGAACAMGACRAAANGDPYEPGPAVDAVWAATSALDAATDGNVAAWNDAPERTADDVIALLERTAAKLDAERVAS